MSSPPSTPPESGPLPVEERFVATQEAIVRYAGASGDFTPIHYDQETLRAAGYDRTFAMGMLTAGHLGTLLVRCFGDGSVVELRTRFRDRCWLGDVVTCRGVVRGPADDRTYAVDLCATSADGRTIADGHARVRSPST